MSLPLSATLPPDVPGRSSHHSTSPVRNKLIVNPCPQGSGHSEAEELDQPCLRILLDNSRKIRKIMAPGAYERRDVFIPRSACYSQAKIYAELRHEVRNVVINVR